MLDGPGGFSSSWGLEEVWGSWGSDTARKGSQREGVEPPCWRKPGGSARRAPNCTGEGQYAAALPLAQRALALREQALGPTHPEVAETLSILGLLYLAQGQYAQAEPLLHRALAIREQLLRGSRSPLIAISLNNLAALYRRSSGPVCAS